MFIDNEEANPKQYGECGKHSFYTIGTDGHRCCAEMSCPSYINKHRTPDYSARLKDEGMKL